MTGLFIELMSGTSMDGIDAALLDFPADRVQLVATRTHAYNSTLLLQLEQALDLEDPPGAGRSAGKHPDCHRRSAPGSAWPDCEALAR